MSEGHPSRTTSTPSEFMSPLDQESTHEDAETPVLDPNERDFYLDDSVLLDMMVEHDNFEIWYNANLAVETTNSPRYDFGYSSYDQPTNSSSAATGPPRYDFGRSVSPLHSSDHFSESALYRPHAQQFIGGTGNFGFNGDLPQAQIHGRQGYIDRGYGQIGTMSSFRFQQPHDAGLSMVVTPAQDATGPLLSYASFYGTQNRVPSPLRELTVPATLVRLGHACFIGTIPLPDLAFHAPGSRISYRTREVLNRPVPGYTRRMSSNELLHTPFPRLAARPNPVAPQPSTSTGINNHHSRPGLDASVAEESDWEESAVSGAASSPALDTSLSHENRELSEEEDSE